MATAGPSGSQKTLTCGVCQEIFTSPRLLPCHHSFCLQCIAGLVNTHGCSFPCPVCRKATLVPPGGVRAFQVNFWITEEELEHAKKNVDNAMCRIHPIEPLIFQCVDCDEAICIRCRLTKHSQHNSEDLSEAASRCKESLTQMKKRLEVAIDRLTQQQVLAQINLTTTERKFEGIKTQIQVQYDTLVVRLQKMRDSTLRNLDDMAPTLRGQLENEVKTLKHELDSLQSLEQRLQEALNDACDAGVVSLEKEMRVGKGREVALARVQKGASTTTHRPGLHCDVSRVTDDDIRSVFGSPVVLTMPNAAPRETIIKTLQCGKEGANREVHAVCIARNGTSRLTYGGIPPKYEKEKKASVARNHDYDALILNELESSGRRTFQAVGEKVVTCLYNCGTDQGDLFQLFSKFSYKTYLQFRPPASCIIHAVIEDSSAENGYRLSDPVFRPHVSMRPFSFDVSRNGQFCILLEEEGAGDRNTAVTGEDAKVRSEEEGTSPKSELKRKVRLYLPNRRLCVATYTPPLLPFLPTDVCFWHFGGQERLLIADWMNDSVHVVRIADETFQFERYLAAGNGDLVKPSVLNTDHENNVWIGCSNGWLLKCVSLEK